jgi:hypothetical protein
MGERKAKPLCYSLTEMSFRKNVFILGAGFSASARAPLMHDFLPRARDLRDDRTSPLSDNDRLVFGRVIEYRYGLNKALAKILEDLDNIEKLFSFLEMEVQLMSTSQQLRDDMKYLIGRTLEVTTDGDLPTGTYGLHVAGKAQQMTGTSYGLFTQISSGYWNPQKIERNLAIDSIITFNYDLVLERELEKRRIRPAYHCGQNADYYPRAFADPAIQMNVLKLHGSINWAVCKECKRLHFMPYQDYRLSALMNYSCTQHCNRTNCLEVLIVPPTWNKGTEEPFIKSVWTQALKELMSAGRIFIIGYSFPETDQFFKFMLGLALAHNNDLVEVYIVNNREDAWKRFLKLFNPYFRERIVHPLTTDAISFIHNQMVPLTRQQ